MTTQYTKTTAEMITFLRSVADAVAKVNEGVPTEVPNMIDGDGFKVIEDFPVPVNFNMGEPFDTVWENGEDANPVCGTVACALGCAAMLGVYPDVAVKFPDTEPAWAPYMALRDKETNAFVGWDDLQVRAGLDNGDDGEPCRALFYGRIGHKTAVEVVNNIRGYAAACEEAGELLNASEWLYQQIYDENCNMRDPDTF